jgi:hypothetical protein
MDTRNQRSFAFIRGFSPRIVAEIEEKLVNEWDVPDYQLRPAA